MFISKPENDKIEQIYFQQDAATAHTDRETVSNTCNNNFIS